MFWDSAARHVSEKQRAAPDAPAHLCCDVYQTASSARSGPTTSTGTVRAASAPAPPAGSSFGYSHDRGMSIQIHDPVLASQCVQQMSMRLVEVVAGQAGQQRDQSRTPRRPRSLDDAIPPGTWELPWSCLQVPNMNTIWYRVHSDSPSPQDGSLDVLHRFMSQAFTLPAIAGLEVYDFPWQDMKRQHWSALLEILLRLRSRIVQDPNRLRSAAEAWGRFLPHSDFHFPPSDSDVNVWFAALVQSANRHSQMVFTLSEEASVQIWHLAKALAAAKNVPKMSVNSQYICYWMRQDDSVMGIVLVLRRSYPSHNQTVFVAPFAHNTNSHDLASILVEAKVRPSWFGSDDLPTLGFYARLKFPTSNMRVPSNDHEGRVALNESLLSARKYGGYQSSRPVCACGWVYCRQTSHRKATSGGTYIDGVMSHFSDLTHGADGRWLIRSSQAVVSGAAAFW